jgi:hypothetical protein
VPHIMPAPPQCIDVEGHLCVPRFTSFMKAVKQS